MEVFLYRKGSDKVEEGFSRDELPALLADETNVVWVDLQGETPEHVEEAKEVLLNVFGFHYLTVEDCIEVRHQPKVEAFENYIYLVVHGIKPGETGPSNFVTKELDAYLGPNFVVTFHVQRFRSLKTVKQHIRSSTYICHRGAAYLLHSILDELIDLYTPIVEDFDKAIEVLEDRVFDMGRANNAVLADIMDVRRAVARLRRISARQLEVLHRIARGEFPQIPEKVLPFYRDVHDHLVRITDLAEGYRDLVASLFDMHFSVIATRTNDVMKTLAVVSAIILPLSLIAGIYGMNFENMPELKTPYGYFLTLLLMVVVTLLLLVYFWYKGWIFQRDNEFVVDTTRQIDDDLGEK
ncbi:MAG: magnesium/cobalt transporter CorA [Chloracidobacterium sp.]|nr:magnesium/cobalt transporter CorA [Chloracidobacterium sp.]